MNVRINFNELEVERCILHLTSYDGESFAHFVGRVEDLTADLTRRADTIRCEDLTFQRGHSDRTHEATIALREVSDHNGNSLGPENASTSVR